MYTVSVDGLAEDHVAEKKTFSLGQLKLRILLKICIIQLKQFNLKITSRVKIVERQAMFNAILMLLCNQVPNVSHFLLHPSEVDLTCHNPDTSLTHVSYDLDC